MRTDFEMIQLYKKIKIQTAVTICRSILETAPSEGPFTNWKEDTNKLKKNLMSNLIENYIWNLIFYYYIFHVFQLFTLDSYPKINSADSCFYEAIIRLRASVTRRITTNRAGFIWQRKEDKWSCSGLNIKYLRNLVSFSLIFFLTLRTHITSSDIQ